MTTATPIGDLLGDWKPDPLPDEAVHVRRSELDSDVWVCVATEIGGDISSLLSPGRVRAVKRFAERQFADGEPIRWVRIDADTWVMRFA